VENTAKLEIWGRAQRKAARPGKCDWGDNLGGQNSARSNVTCPERSCIARIRWILGQFFNFHCEKNCWGTLVPGGCGLASLGHAQAHLKIWGGSTPCGPKY